MKDHPVRPACAPNIGPRGRRTRGTAGLAGLAGSAAIATLLISSDRAPTTAVFLFPLFWGSWIGVLQARRGV
jgi:hypothetical protein